MKMFRPNRDPPLDDAGTLVPVYHAVELLSAVHTVTQMQMVTAADCQQASEVRQSIIY